MWRKSRHSSTTAGEERCVEVTVLTSGLRAIRASALPDGPWLLVTREQLRELFNAIKAR